MTRYIDKDALVAEIERRIENCAKQREDMLNVQCHTLADDASARMGELNCIKEFLNTLEVKEVDLEEEITSQIRLLNGVHTLDNGKQWWKGTYNELYYFAKHFFELGLKAKEE